MRTTRRTAMKAMAVCLFAPCVQLRRTIDREALLAAFCDNGEETYRYDLQSPFSVGSLTYATDAKHAVRAELSNVRTDGQRRIPRIEDCWNHHWKVASPWRGVDGEPELLVPPDPQTTGITCPACGNRRVSFGEYYPDQDVMSCLVDALEYDVDDNSHRDPSCEACHGRLYLGPSEVVLSGVRLTYWRAKAMLALPDLRVAASAVDCCLLFRADGFEGIAMGLANAT